MAEIELADRIIAHIRTRGPLKAKQIADALGVDRSAINSELYGRLRGRVRQGKDYNWSLTEARGQQAALNDTPARNSYEGLFKYYLDCLSQDDDSGVRTFADSKFDLDYVELEAWPFEASGSALRDCVISGRNGLGWRLLPQTCFVRRAIFAT